MRWAVSFRAVRYLAAPTFASAMMLYAPLSVASDDSAIMRSTVDHWLATQTAGGLFPYGFDFLADRPMEAHGMSPSNLIRQAGTVSALAAYYRYTRDERLQEPIQRALSALGRHSLPIGKSQAQYWVERTRVLSLPIARWKLLFALQRFDLLYENTGTGKVVSPDGDYGGAFAGTAALSLLAEVIYASAAGDNRFAELRLAWLEGLLSLRIPGGGFRQTPTSIDDSDYFNGEGWLAIAVYSDLYRDDVRTAAQLSDLDHAMIERYSQNPSRGFFLWGARAAAQRYATTRDPRFARFVREQADLFLAKFQKALDPDHNHCPAMEGVAATLTVLNQSGENDTDRVRKLRSWLTQETVRLPKLQIQPGQADMALGGEARLRAPSMLQFSGAFLLGLYEPTTRIDLGEHCFWAILLAVDSPGAASR